ncbi:hypothetical protein Plhal304r1_c004g0014911 [Plasmopara halstedii]
MLNIVLRTLQKLFSGRKQSIRNKTMGFAGAMPSTQSLEKTPNSEQSTVRST